MKDEWNIVKIKFTDVLHAKLLMLGCREIEVNGFTIKFMDNLGNVYGYKVNNLFVYQKCGDGAFYVTEHFLICRDYLRIGLYIAQKDMVFIKGNDKDLLSRYGSIQVLHDLPNLMSPNNNADTYKAEVIVCINKGSRYDDFLINKDGKKLKIYGNTLRKRENSVPYEIVQSKYFNGNMYKVYNSRKDRIITVDAELNVLKQ